MRTETRHFSVGRPLGFLPAALFRRTRSKHRDDGGGDDSPGGAAAVASPPIRRNGNREAVNGVSPVRLSSVALPRHRPSWSVSGLQTRSVPFRTVGTVALVLLVAGLVRAQSGAPIVTMRVTLADGHVEELTAPESGLATLRTADGTEYGFRPTIQDSAPWTRIVVTIFKMATAHAATTTLGELEVKTNGPAAASKTTPSFKIAVPKVAPPAAVRSTT